MSRPFVEARTTPERRGPRIRPDGRRRAAIGRLYRDRPRRWAGCSREYRPKPNPYLRLSGNWLGEAGFPIGQEIAVEVDDGRLVIEAVPS